MSTRRGPTASTLISEASPSAAIFGAPYPARWLHRPLRLKWTVGASPDPYRVLWSNDRATTALPADSCAGGCFS